jgi:hypothetical protein
MRDRLDGAEASVLSLSANATSEALRNHRSGWFLSPDKDRSSLSDMRFRVSDVVVWNALYV